MKQKPEIVRTKNEATGMRVVSQYVTEFWECGWQPYDQRNDKGIDGEILMRKGGQDLGVNINVQVKCGVNYISSFTKDEIKISISNKLEEHIQYWKKQINPTILVFVIPYIPKRDKHGNIEKEEVISKSGVKRIETVWKESRIKAQGYWVNIKDEDAFDANNKTIIKINKNKRFGEHSKGDFLKLVRPHLSLSDFPKIKFQQESIKLYNSFNLFIDAKKYYQEWKSKDDGLFYCCAIDKEIIISNTGWNHINKKSRGKIKRYNSLRLLGVAKQILSEVKKYYLLQQKDYEEYTEQKIGIKGRIKTKHENEQLIQVIIVRRINKSNNLDKYWFYSVHHRT